jgi:hypothetical protein
MKCSQNIATGPLPPVAAQQAEPAPRLSLYYANVNNAERGHDAGYTREARAFARTHLISRLPRLHQLNQRIELRLRNLPLFETYLELLLEFRSFGDGESHPFTCLLLNASNDFRTVDLFGLAGWCTHCSSFFLLQNAAFPRPAARSNSHSRVLPPLAPPHRLSFSPDRDMFVFPRGKKRHRRRRLNRAHSPGRLWRTKP